MIGIDVGGANTKVVDGTTVTIRYAPLWERAALADTLCELVQGKDVQHAAVVMSGELADCFSSKTEGIAYIVHAVRKVIPSARFYGTDAQFHRAPVPELAAGNWLASADYLKDQYPNAVLVDMGSTTTDIIPLRRFSWLRGLTDYDRLQKGYLSYTGLLRTPVAAHLPRVTIAGRDMGTSPEYFAISADVHLVLGHISPAEYTCPTPDHRAATREDALRRLARVVCADLEEIGPEGVTEIAEQFWEAQRRAILTAIQAAARESGSREVIAAGTGSRLIAGISGGLDLRDALGDVVDALPAYAVKEVAQRTGLS